LSRTTLCVATAASLAVLSIGMMVTRYRVLGGEVQAPAGAGAWKVTLMVHGFSHGDARVITTAPLDVSRQHILSEDYTCAQMVHKAGDDKRSKEEEGRRQVFWSRRANEPDGPFRVRCDYLVSIDVKHPSAPMSRVAHGLAAPPQPGEYLDRESKAETDNERITAQARLQTVGLENPTDVAEAIYHFVSNEIQSEPSVGGPAVGAAECLRLGGGDCAAKSRLLVAMLRNRGIPARLVTGVSLTKVAEQRAHYWVEAWLRERWLPMCPSYRHFGKVPSNYLIFGYGDQPLVRGRHVRDLDYAFLVEHASAQKEEKSGLKSFFLAVSLYILPPAEQRLVEFLLLLPVAALVICVYRNLIGLNSFGVFAPALVGLAFRDLRSLPGIFVFISILLVGWLMRRVLDSYHLLQVPRVSLMLSLIVIVLILAIVGANYHDFPATKYISLFPMIILTGMVERFWTLENEDSVASSFRTLLTTMLIAATISVVLSVHAMVRYLFAYPETLGLIMAVQLVIGRYTGYRLLELFRFRDFLKSPPSPLRLVGGE
jgi:7 transmembrane helices usually fused to an inactive transglutaminase/Transglutaminase-like superfamily